MPLTDLQLRALRSKPVVGKHGDRDGLYLRVDARGGMSWQWRIRTATGENTVSYGSYPKVSLAEARQRHAEARQQVRDGLNPNQLKKAQKAAPQPDDNTFETVARDWFKTRKDEWAPSYSEKLIRRLECDVFPFVGKRAIDGLTPPELLTVLRRVEARGVIETAHRALESISQVFRYAIASGSATTNPARDLKDALRKPVPQHFPAITDPTRFGELLRAAAGYRGTDVVRAALTLAPMVLLRPGELRHAQWSEFDLDAGIWTVPAVRMKREKAGKLHGKPHIVPLATQAVAALRALRQVTGPDGYVFRGERHHDRPMSDAAVNAALRAMGFAQTEVTAHGFRATARTIMAEKLGIPEAVIEAQLAHAVKDSLGRAYNRTEYLAERTAMMQTWADYLDKLRRGADVVKLFGVAA